MAFFHAWEGREGDAGGFEFEMLVQLLDDHHPTGSKKALSFRNNSQAPRSTENAQYMTEDFVFQTCISVYILCQETLLGPERI